MDAASIVLILAAAGVNFGWQPTDDTPGGLEYIVQVEPELLDELKRGDAPPIESNVPPEIGPIRKISIVVGRGELPRTSASAVNRTSYFAGESAWAPDRFSTAAPATPSTYDRYGPPPGVANSDVGPPPSLIDRTQTAVTETGTTLRDGVEAGIQAANQQLSRGGGQVLDATRDASQEFGRQLQDWTKDPAGQLQSTSNNVRTATERTLGTVGNQLQQFGNPFANSSSQPVVGTRPQSNVAPPPWPNAATGAATAPAPQFSAVGQTTDPTASRGMAPTKTASGWTTIGPNVAAPPLLIPQLGFPPNNTASAPSQTAAANTGPRIPEQRPPRAAPVNPADDWASGWGTEMAPSQATIGRAVNVPAVEPQARDLDLVPVQPAPGSQSAQQSTGQGADIWAETERWSQAPSSTPAVPVAQGSNNGATNLSDIDDWQRGGDRSPAVSINDHASQPPLGAVVNSPAGPAMPNNAQQTPPISATNTNQAPQSAANAQPPWLPLLVVSLSLMGSLSANLFLGWSYMDARQKHRSLVRKTADTFRRPKTAAA